MQQNDTEKTTPKLEFTVEVNNNKIISGATILGDGEVALILDVNTLM